MLHEDSIIDGKETHSKREFSDFLPTTVVDLLVKLLGEKSAVQLPRVLLFGTSYI